jgi:hypothetical protein
VKTNAVTALVIPCLDPMKCNSLLNTMHTITKFMNYHIHIIGFLVLCLCTENQEQILDILEGRTLNALRYK